MGGIIVHVGHRMGGIGWGASSGVVPGRASSGQSLSWTPLDIVSAV